MSDSRSYFVSYGTCAGTHAVFRVDTGAMEPAFVTRRLDLEGTPIENAWVLSTEGKSASLDLRRHLDWLLNKLAPRAERLRDLRTVPGVSMQIRCVWWSADGHGGPTLWPAQLSLMAELDLDCVLDFMFFDPTFTRLWSRPE